MNRPPKCLKLSILLGRVIFEEQLKKIYIFGPKSDFRITIVCPSVWNQNPLTSEITFIWSLISQISYLSYNCTYQLSDQLLQLLNFFGLLHFIFRFPTCCQARVQVQGLSQIYNKRPGTGVCSYRVFFIESRKVICYKMLKISLFMLVLDLEQR